MWARVGMGEVRAVVQVDTEGSQLEDLALEGQRDDPVGRKEEVHPGVPLVRRELPAAGEEPCRDPRDRPMREEADQRALRGLEEAPAGFKGCEAHGRLAEWSPYMTCDFARE